MNTDLGTWSSISDVDTFLNRFSHNTAYKDGDTKLRVGNYVTIQDGTYNAVWEIAGFDIEHNQKASDGTVYDNGYGIFMVPKTTLTTAQWNDYYLTGGYISSAIHTSYIPTAINVLKNILGSHIVNRNVLLSSSVDSNNYSNAYTWTTADATLMSWGQMSGTFASHRNKYDDGEANYKLPLFNSGGLSSTYFWTRYIYGKYGSGYCAWSVSGTTISNSYVNGDNGVRPLIYLR